ncbi:hypothetical protein [Adlercreutzia sp. ZJ176]|uniref:hypothetical protein n=1 Tax=Adlercreutzia sp. ZJ176 TaxID=2709407 RepID=UPI0013EB178D|nr:hypothetical protein [Adlercreutzia sp. ZJ176]
MVAKMKLTLYKDGHSRIPNSNGYAIGEQRRESACSYCEGAYDEGEREGICGNREPLVPIYDLVQRWSDDDEPLGDLTVRAFRLEYGGKTKMFSVYRQLSKGGDYQNYSDVRGLVDFICENEDRINKAVERIEEQAKRLIEDIGAAAETGKQSALDKALGDGL